MRRWYVAARRNNVTSVLTLVSVVVAGAASEGAQAAQHMEVSGVRRGGQDYSLAGTERPVQDGRPAVTTREARTPEEKAGAG